MNKTGTRSIDTHRLTLRQFRMEDADYMYSNWAVLLETLNRS